MPDYIQAFGGDDEGYQIGNATTSKVGFFGAAPVVQQTLTTMVTPVLSQVATSGKWGFSNSTAALLIFTRLRALHTKLDTLGLIDRV